jgi:hypothetical protein
MAHRSIISRASTIVFYLFEATSMKRIATVGLLAFALAAIWGTSKAQAQGPYCGGWGGCGINFPYGLYGSRVNDVPYFSMFPPVYYSLPVPRTYGWSPFAYPPGTMTPEVEPAQPQDMVNPYVPQNKEKGEAKPTSMHTAAYRAPTPQVLINPYVQAAKVAAASTNAASTIAAQ